MLFFALYILPSSEIQKYSYTNARQYTKLFVPFYVPSYIFIVLIFQRSLQLPHMYFQVNEALKAQIDTLWHTTSIYMHPKIHEYAEKLTATLPEPLKCVYFVNSGSEANDMAMMIARVYTGNFDILSFRNSYHGKYVL